MRTNLHFHPVLNIVSVLTLLGLMLSIMVAGVSEAQTNSKKVEVVIDHSNKQKIKGTIHIALAWGDQLIPPQKYIRGFFNLKEAMHRWTKIETRIDSHLYLSSPRLLKMPFIYITTDRAFELSKIEKKNVKKYFDSGGFMVLDNAIPAVDNSQSSTSLRKMLRDVLGAHARFLPIPISHPFYHCFFDFDDGPPIGAELLYTNTVWKPEKNELLNVNTSRIISEYIPRERPFLEGVFYKDRLIAVFSDKGYIIRWNDMTDNYPQLKMGVNMIVFSLIQEGGIASQ
ncbi:DUF4159 domain-containing protein [Candidatus Latescibacterota bacterium]